MSASPVPAAKRFDRFFASETLEDALINFRETIEAAGIGYGDPSRFYPRIKEFVHSTNGLNIFRVIDEKRKCLVYENGTACGGISTMIVGCGPCGLRMGIECQLLGCNVVMLEKRTSFTRNNVLHIWPFVIEDLKSLGVKVFYPKFCTGSMNHISIRRLQLILMKIALIVGVQVFVGVSFISLREPGNEDENDSNWRVECTPALCTVNQMSFDVVVGAEGKHVTIPGFERREFRGKLAIAITANFENKHTTAEAIVEEISGVAFVYKQDFFNSLYEELGIALENIVYYKDETHYFVMTTKKHSLLDRGVLKEDFKDPVSLLSPSNVRMDCLVDYIRDTCDYCTDYQLPNLQFALNHRGTPDVALFDFTSMYAARNSVYVNERRGKQLLCFIIGDGLLEPFWPTGTGCARGFLGVFDSCWTLRNWAAQRKSIYELLAEREALYKLLPQTTPQNLNKDWKKYSVEPASRYTAGVIPVSMEKIHGLYDSDNVENGYEPPQLARRRSKVAPAEAILPKMIYETASQRLETTSSDVLLLKRSSTAVAAMKTGSRSAYAAIAADKAATRRMLQAQSRGGGATGAAGGEKRSKVGHLKTRVLARDEGNYPGRKVKDDILQEEPQRKSSNFNEKVTVLKNVIEGDRKGAAAATKKTQNKTEKMRMKKQQSQNSDKLSLNERKPAKPVNVDILCGIVNKPEINNLDSDVYGGGGDVDDELNHLLSELEFDESFQKLSDNEKMSWLESLFYQDTRPKVHSIMRRDGEVQTRCPRQRDQLHRSPAAALGATKIEGRSRSPVKKAAAVIRSTNKTVIDSIAPQTPNLKPRSSSAEVTVNENLISLAQSYFSPASTNKPAIGMGQHDGKKIPEIEKKETQNHQANQFSSVSEGVKPTETLDTSSTDCCVAPAKSLPDPSSSTAPPPIPPRSVQPKTAMLRLMSSATNILKR